MENVIVIVGPTASGKTTLAIELAKRINGEIVSADSMQVYKYMDIGTAKPDTEERQGIKHYLIDEVTPDEEFNVVKYKTLALKYIKEIINKGKTPIVAGGTGLYINSLIYNIQFSETESDWRYREHLKNVAKKMGNKYLHDQLAIIDAEAAERIHVNDLKRIIRALEVYESTRKPISQHNENSRLSPPQYRYIVIGLEMNRKILYERINLRVDLMFEKGLVEEIKKLEKLGYDRSKVAMQGLGYKEILWYLKGTATREEAIYFLKRDTRRYAKRQITWFKRIKDVFWVNLDECNDLPDVLKKIADHIAIYGIIL